MLQQLLTITRNTFVESIRQPIFVVMILLGILLLLLNPQLAAYTLESGHDNKMLIDMGLSTIFLAGLLLGAFTATGVLVSELENKTVLTVVSKPVARPLFVLGKFAGVAGAIAVAYYVLSIIFVLTVRHRVMQTASDHFDGPVIVFGLGGGLIALGLATWGNYFYRWVFSSTFCLCLGVTQTIALLMVLLIDKQWQFQSPLTDILANDGEIGQVIVGLMLIFEAVLVLSAVAIAASTRLGQVMTLLICFGVFVTGLFSNWMSQWANNRLGISPQLGAYDSVAAVVAADVPLHLKMIHLPVKLLYLLLPNLQFLWPADAITQGNAISLEYMATTSAFAALHCIVALSLAVVLFQTREVG